MDIMMPVMDGYTFLDTIKTDAELALIPVIVTTQGDSEADEVKCSCSWCNRFWYLVPYRPSR
ncbi:MAG: hypothetical protein ACLRZZ_05960 [Enterocloster sp.]